MTDQDGDLDRRLSDLFATADLSLAPRRDAASVLVTRVRRARRRRQALQIAGPIAAVALLSVAVASARPFHSPERPAHSVAGPALRQELAMTGTSVGTLRLGMTKAQAEATGLLVLPATNPGSSCLNYTGKNGIRTVRLGASGVSSIEVYTFIRTPEGAGIGDTYAKLQASYPSLPEQPAKGVTYRVPVPGQSSSYVFGLFAQDQDGQPITPTRESRVDSLSLRGNDSACPKN